MNKIIKSILIFIVCISLFFSIFNIITNLISIFNSIQNLNNTKDLITSYQDKSSTEFQMLERDIEIYNYLIFSNFKELFFPVILCSICITQIIFMLKNTNLENFTKYTYEEYKAVMDKKKAEKQEKKKQKLQQQLNDLENID